MIELKGDIFDYADAEWNDVDALCVLTNMTVKANGNLIMGGGQALIAAQKFPELPQFWGAKTEQLIEQAYHRVTILTRLGRFDKYCLISFPTKKHPKESSSLPLILQAATELVQLADNRKWQNVVLPRPGCGLGGLDWYTDVRPTIENVLDNRFKVMTF